MHEIWIPSTNTLVGGGTYFNRTNFQNWFETMVIFENEFFFLKKIETKFRIINFILMIK